MVSVRVQMSLLQSAIYAALLSIQRNWKESWDFRGTRHIYSQPEKTASKKIFIHTRYQEVTSKLAIKPRYVEVRGIRQGKVFSYDQKHAVVQSAPTTTIPSSMKPNTADYTTSLPLSTLELMPSTFCSTSSLSTPGVSSPNL